MSTRVDRAELLRRYERRLQLMVPGGGRALRGLPLFAGIPEKARDKVIEKVRKYLHFSSSSRATSCCARATTATPRTTSSRARSRSLLRPAGRAADGRRRRRCGAAPTCRRPSGRARGPGAEGMIGRGGTCRRTVILSAFPAELVARRQRTILEPGEIFGEIGALSRYPVSATVRAETPLRLLQIRLPGLRMLHGALEGVQEVPRHPLPRAHAGPAPAQRRACSPTWTTR